MWPHATDSARHSARHVSRPARNSASWRRHWLHAMSPASLMWRPFAPQTTTARRRRHPGEASRREAPTAWVLCRLLEGEDAPPVVLHIDDRPTPRIGLIKRLVQFRDPPFPIIGPFPSSVGVVNEHH